MNLASNIVSISIGIAIGISIGIGIGFGTFGNTTNLEKQIEEQGSKIVILESELESANEKINSLEESRQPDMVSMTEMMMQNPEMLEKFTDLIMNEPKLMQAMMQEMGEAQTMGSMSSQTSSSMRNQMFEFNPKVQITIPMIDGYYNGEKVFFIHTEVSDENMASMMTRMINFPTLHIPSLGDTSEENMAKLYVFTNGIPGSGPYGGGPFMFQIDIFDSIPGQEGYNQFRVLHLVTWNDGATPRVLTSLENLLEAQMNGELKIQKTDKVVNAPMIIWSEEDNGEQVVSRIENVYESMPDFEGEVVNVDDDNYIVTLKIQP